jgi:sugar O-acyltransferase (sialic acid O-acetyltransferase NeuD family)
MRQSKLILVGAGGHARSCIDVIEQEGRYKIIGLVGLPHEIGYKHFDYEVIATDSELFDLAKECPNALISLGQIETAIHRVRLHQLTSEVGFQFVTIVSPTAYVSPRAKIGSGTIVMQGAVVKAGAVVGDNCIINSNSLVEHDVRIEDHCHISTGAIVNGGSSIGVGTFIGSGGVVKESVSIGANSLIGMGISVLQDLPSNTKFLG